MVLRQACWGAGVDHGINARKFRNRGYDAVNRYTHDSPRIIDPDDQAPARTVGKGHQGFEQVLRRGQITLELLRLALGL